MFLLHWAHKLCNLTRIWILKHDFKMYLIPRYEKDASLEIDAASALIMSFYVSFFKKKKKILPILFLCLTQRVLVSLVVHLYLKIQELLLQAWFPKSTGSKSLKVKCERKRSFELKSHHLGPARMFEKSGGFFWPTYTRVTGRLWQMC